MVRCSQDFVYNPPIRSIGGMNNQSYAAAGVEANLDTQVGFGLTWPTPGTFYSTSGKPPFNPDTLMPDDMNEPYANVRLSYCGTI
jgi:hypothetical protein